MSTTKRAADPGAEQREGFTIDRYAEVMAHRRHFHPSLRTEVLLRLGITPKRWAAATKAWGAALAEGLAGDEPSVVVRFVQTLGRTTRRLSEYPPRLEALGEPIDPNTAEPGERAPEVALPSYLSAQPTAAAMPIAAPMPVPAPPAVTPAPQPVSVRARPGLGETADISAFIPRTELPFQGQTAAPATPPRPGAFLRRFDPETGEPLAVPVWEDPPEGSVPRQ